MTDEPVPIRPGVLPEFDGEREMVDYLAGRVRLYAQRFGRAPTAAAVAFISDMGDADEAHSWTPGEQRRGATCSRASVLFLQRALD